MEIKNAVIQGTMLGIEDHGILSCMIDLDYGDSSQGFGGYDFDVKSNFGAQFIRRVLEVVGVSKWENLKGKHVRVKRPEGRGGVIIAIGNIIKNDWFDPNELAREMDCPVKVSEA